MPAFEMPLEQLKEYKGCTPRPSDFDDYWEYALSEADKLSLEYTLTPAVFKAPGVRCYDMWFTGILGARIHCKFIVPERIEGKIPAVLYFHGYMHHSGEWFERLPYAYANMAVVSMDIRGQGGISEDVFSGVGPTIFGGVVRGVNDPDPQNLYYRNVFIDAVQLVRILMSMDCVDENRIAVTGKSQGGGISVAVSGLVPNIKLCAPIYPFLSDYKRIVDMDLDRIAYEGLYFYFKKCDPTHAHEREFYEKLGYIDIQNFAPRIRAKVLWQTGLMDSTCPASTQFAAYNKITADKNIILYPDHDHEMIYFANDRIFEFFTNKL